MRCTLLISVFLAFSSAAFALPECALVHKGMDWQRGTLVKFLVVERSEGGETAAGQLLRLTVKSGETTLVAQCAVGTSGCDPASLKAGGDLSFVILDKKGTQTLVFAKPDGHLICAPVASR